MFETKEKIRNMVRQEVIACHDRIGTRLFGDNNKKCLNLRAESESDNFNSDVYDFLNNGSHNIIGQMIDRIAELEAEVDRLNQNEALIAKAQAKE